MLYSDMHDKSYCPSSLAEIRETLIEHDLQPIADAMQDLDSFITRKTRRFNASAIARKFGFSSSAALGMLRKARKVLRPYIEK